MEPFCRPTSPCSHLFTEQRNFATVVNEGSWRGGGRGRMDLLRLDGGQATDREILRDACRGMGEEGSEPRGWVAFHARRGKDTISPSDLLEGTACWHLLVRPFQTSDNCGGGRAKPTMSVFITQKPRTHTLAVGPDWGVARLTFPSADGCIPASFCPFLLAVFQYLKRGPACEAQTGLSWVTYLSVPRAE